MAKTPRSSKPPQLEFEPDPALEAMIEERALQIAKEEAVAWRFRLVTIETMMMGALVLAAGLALGQPALLVLRASVMVSAGCFASGILLIGLTGAADKAIARLRLWRRGK